MHADYPRKIIFDMDGVITSEECYWNTAALVVWELLFSRRGIGLPTLPSLPAFTPAPPPSRVTAIRRVIFQDDRVITFFKRRAVNSNWDLTFYTFTFQLVQLLNQYATLLLQEDTCCPAGDNFSLELLPRLGSFLSSCTDLTWQPPFAAVLEDWCGEATGAELGAKLHAQLSGDLAAAFPSSIFRPASPLWEGVRRTFQGWYLGDAGYREIYGRMPEIPGKKGFLKEEQPLLPVARVKATFDELHRQGWILGAATGRPGNELLPPLARLGLLEYFDKGSLVTFDLIEQVQQALQAKGERLSLGKPHPFSLLKAYWGNIYPQQAFFYPPFPSPPAAHCWLVGDAPADLLAAQAAGIACIAVLTGHEGVAGRDYFRAKGADAVLPELTHIPSFLKASACL